MTSVISGASLDAAMKAIDYAGFPARKEKAKQEGKLRGIWRVLLHRGLRHRAVEGGRQALAPAVGLWESAEIRVNPVGTIEGPDRVRTATAKAMKPPSRNWSSERLGVPISQVADCPRRYRQGAIRHGNLWLSLQLRSAGTAIVKGDGEGRGPRPKKIARAPNWRLPRTTSSSRTANSKVAGTDKSIALPMVGARGPTPPHKPARRHGARFEGNRILRPDQLHLPGRDLYLRTRGRFPAPAQDQLRQFRRRPTIFGRLINPMIVEGQVHGGLAQGIGQALLEGAGL